MVEIDKKGNVLKEKRTKKLMYFSITMLFCGWGETEEEAKEQALENLGDEWGEINPYDYDIKFEEISDEEDIDEDN